VFLNGQAEDAVKKTREVVESKCAKEASYLKDLVDRLKDQASTHSPVPTSLQGVGNPKVHHIYVFRGIKNWRVDEASTRSPVPTSLQGVEDPKLQNMCFCGDFAGGSEIKV
jgi:hypothetical protein